MVKIGIVLISCLVFNTSIYTFKVTGLTGSEIDFDDFRNKKILLVNIATNSPRVNQLSELQQLHTLYGDSLVIVAFPSNSFGNEPRDNEDIGTFCQVNYNTGFLIASKGAVTGQEAQPVYQWLASPGENGVLAGSVTKDFQKFLIGKDGSLIGVYAPMISPMDSVVQNAVRGIE